MGAISHSGPASHRVNRQHARCDAPHRACRRRGPPSRGRPLAARLRRVAVRGRLRRLPRPGPHLRHRPSLVELFADSRALAPEAGIAGMDDLRQVMDLLAKMDKREAAVLRMRYGLDDEEPKTLNEIGDRLGLTRERVRQIEVEALAKLREQLEAA